MRTDTTVAEAAQTVGDTQSPFSFALDAPTDRPLVLRAGLRRPDSQFWLTEPHAIARDRGCLAAALCAPSPRRPWALPACWIAAASICEIGFLPEELRLRFNEQVLTMVPRPAASGAYYEQADNPATSAHLKDDSAILTIDGAQLAECRFIAASAELARGSGT